MLGTKEFYDLMDMFEKTAKKAVWVKGAFDREDKELFKKQYYYQNGEVNEMFKLFMLGYSYGKAINY